MTSPQAFFFQLLPAVFLDWWVGDPHWMPHPVRWMGRWISWLESVLRPHFPQTKQGLRWAGILLVLLTVLVCLASCFVVLGICGLISPWLWWVVEVWFSSQLLAAKSLQKESEAVYPYLKQGDLPGARKAVSRIVGRDTATLDEEGVAKAAVETVAENTSDGIIAPMIFLFFGGLPGLVLYKAVNTMDSMVGYRNEQYEHFGWAAAHLDDILNFIPARVAGGLMCLVAGILPGFSGKRAWKIFLRDRKKHKSPNSAHTEASCAGACGIQLAGDASYFGKVVSKPTIGDGLCSICPEDIFKSVQLMYGTQIALLCFLGLLVWGWR